MTRNLPCQRIREQFKIKDKDELSDQKRAERHLPSLYIAKGQQSK